MHRPTIYTRPEIVNGTGFARDARFVAVESVAHLLARLICVAHVSSDINVGAEGRAIMAEARAYLATLDTK